MTAAQGSQARDGTSYVDQPLTRRLLEQLIRLRPHHVHAHGPVRDVNREFDERLTFGQRIADGVAATMGSWRFIIIQSVLLACWVTLNVVAAINHWDPYPFILLNLMLSFQAAYAAPIIMMSQNRQAAKDRLGAQHDYEINTKAEDEVRAILQHLEYQDELMLRILHHLEEHLSGRVSPDDGAGQAAAPAADDTPV